MKKGEKPYRVTLWARGANGEMEIDFKHPLSDGFGIPAVVVGCPQAKQLDKYDGLDECGEKVVGISFDECCDCPYFDSLDFSQAIICGQMR